MWDLIHQGGSLYIIASKLKGFYLGIANNSMD
jgi:hypothetical protein